MCVFCFRYTAYKVYYQMLSTSSGGDRVRRSTPNGIEPNLSELVTLTGGRYHVIASDDQHSLSVKSTGFSFYLHEMIKLLDLDQVESALTQAWRNENLGQSLI